MMNFMKKHSKAILVLIAIALAITLIVGVVLLHGNKPEPNFGTYTDPTETTSGTETTGATVPEATISPTTATEPAVNPSTEPSMAPPDETVAPTIEATVPNHSGETGGDVTGTTEPTAPPATEPKPTTPKPTEPKPTTPKPTGPTAPKPTEPKPTEPEETEPEETEPTDEYGGVTPSNITPENTAGWSSSTFDFFWLDYQKSMTPAQKHAFYYAKYDGYECGFPGHCCKNASDHNRLVQQLSRPCQYCGLISCTSRLYTDPDNLYIYCADKYCDSYSVEKDPSKYCQTCGKPHWGANVTTDRTQLCTQYLTDGPCDFCGVYVKAHACHTCKQEDIDNYKKN